MSFYQTSNQVNFSVVPRGKLQAPYGTIQHYPASAEITGSVAMTDSPANFMLIANGVFLKKDSGAFTVALPTYGESASFHEQLWEFLGSNKRNVSNGDFFVIEGINTSGSGALVFTQGETSRSIATGVCGCVVLQCTVTNQQGGGATHAFTLL